jgi:hypothetical protein
MKNEKGKMKNGEEAMNSELLTMSRGKNEK